MVELLARAQLEQGHRVTVIAGVGPHSQTPHETFDGVEVHRLPVEQALQAKDLRWLHRMTRPLTGVVGDDALCHFQHPGPALMAHRLVHPTCAGGVMTFHSEAGVGFLAGGSPPGLVVARSAQLTAVSSYVAALARRRLGGRDIDVIRSVVGSVADRWASARVPGQVAVMARLHHEKGVDVAVRAVAELAADSVEVRLVVAGDGVERGALEEQAHELGVGGRVEFRGELDALGVRQLTDESAAVIVPSRSEGLSMTALEAAAAGRAVVASAVGGLLEVIEDGVTGLLVPPGDVAALASAIRRLCDEPDLGECLGRNALEQARASGPIAAWAEEYEQVYERVGATQ